MSIRKSHINLHWSKSFKKSKTWIYWNWIYYVWPTGISTERDIPTTNFVEYIITITHQKYLQLWVIFVCTYLEVTNYRVKRLYARKRARYRFPLSPTISCLSLKFAFFINQVYPRFCFPPSKVMLLIFLNTCYIRKNNLLQDN